MQFIVTYEEMNNKNSKWMLVEELHRQARRNFKRRSTLMRGIDDTLQADLVEMIPYASKNDNMKYILTVINIFSKKAYTRAVKNKSGPEVAKAMDSVLNSLGHPIRNLHVDNGKEFYNKHMENVLRKWNVKIYSTYTTKKAAIVERFNRTLKNKMWKQFSYRGSHKWIDILPTLVSEYNNTKHRTIKMKPNEVLDGGDGIERYLLNTAYAENQSNAIRNGPKFKIGAHVRISKYKHVFAKGFTPNWTTEIFKIRRIQDTNPFTYLLMDADDRHINGSFYTEELQLVKDPKLFLVEKIIKTRGDEIFVKWLGFGSEHNSWIKKINVLD